MKRSNLFYLALVMALLTGLAHLRSDWLAGAPERTEPPRPRVEERTTAWSLRQNEPRVWLPFLRQR
jgi:hypothetical protein